MNNKLLILLAIAIMAIPVASACGRTAVVNGVPIAPPLNHPIDVRFENCNACHVKDQLDATPLPHVGMNFTNAQCTQPGCHVRETGTTTTTPPPSTSTTPPTSTGGTETTSTAPKILTDVAVPITNHNLAGLTAYKSIGCLFCHGPGQSYAQPYAPSWDATTSASTHNTGVFTVTAASKADHTGYTNATDCEQAGCHAVPTS